MYWYDLNRFDRKTLYHSYHRGDKQIALGVNTVIEYGYYEDGYFRGVRKGWHSKFLNFTAPEHTIICKACGERVQLDNLGRLL